MKNDTPCNVFVVRQLICLVGYLCLALSSFGVPTFYYVATAADGGSDANNGTSLSTPFATIGKARDVIRATKGTMTDDIIVLIRGGKYYVESTIAFNEQDSANNGFNICYQNYPGERPEIIGGKPVTGWTLHSGSIYKATLPTLSGGVGWKPWALFENRTRSVQARTPNTGHFLTDTPPTSGGTVLTNPYNTIEAERFNINSGTVNTFGGSPTYIVLTNIDVNDYVAFTNVDFRAAGANSFTAVLANTDANRTIELRLGSATGTLIGTLALASTGSLSTYQAQMVNLTTIPTGIQDVYVVFKGGATGVWNTRIDWLQFAPTGTNDQAPLQAEAYTSMSGVTTESGGSGTVVANGNMNDWIAYSVNCGTLGNIEVDMQVAVPTANTYMKIEMWVDSLGVAGTTKNWVLLPDTRTTGLYKTIKFSMEGVTGTRTLYFRFRGTTGEICKVDWLRIRSVAPVVDDSRRKFTYLSANSAAIPSAANYANAQVNIWPGLNFYHYFEETLPIQQIDFSTRTVTTTDTPIYSIGSGVEFYLQNVLDFLDQPGEFFFNESTATLYYWPRTAPITSQEIIAATTTRIFELKGSAPGLTTSVVGLNFYGLDITISNYAKSRTLPAATDTEGMIYLENAVANYFENCRITNAGINAIVMKYYCQYNTVKNNLISGFGHNGIYLFSWTVGDGNFTSIANSYINKLNVVSNNMISDGGELSKMGSAFYLAQSGNNDISYNRIQRMPKFAFGQFSLPTIRFNWLNFYGADATSANYLDFLHTRNNTIRNNDMFNCHYATNDGGPIDSYGTGGKDIGGTSGTGHIVQFNRIHDTRTIFSGVSAISGIYLDGDSALHDVRYNWIYNINSVAGKAHAVFFKGRDNIFNNNVVAKNDGTMDLLFLHYPSFTTLGQVITKNIFYATASERVNCYDFLISTYWDDNTIATSNNNVFYHSGGSYNMKNVQNSATAISFPAWKSILSNKYDQNSTTGIAPTFANLGLNNYSVSSGAPAGWTNFTLSPVNFTEGPVAVNTPIGPGVDFPYPPDFRFYDGFENGTFLWKSYFGTPGTSTAQKKYGANSLGFDQDQDSVLRYFGATPQNRVVSLWFYDNAADTTQIIQANVDNGATSIAIGVHTGVPGGTTNYVYRIGGTYTVTTIPRTTGWHQFVFDFRSGSDVKLYIDPTPSNLTPFATSTALTGFTQIILGDSWPDGQTAAGFYFDHIALADDLPATMTVFQDGFENCVDAWATDFGTARSSSEQVRQGLSSYSVLQDQDAISHEMGASYNREVSLWFYDSGDTDMVAYAYVDNGATDIAIGINTGVSANYYTVKIGSGAAASSVARTTGWHRLRWNYSSGTGVSLSIDGTAVAISSALTQFSKIRLGDYNADGKTGLVYFDDLIVY